VVGRRAALVAMDTPRALSRDRATTGAPDREPPQRPRPIPDGGAP
jgi:hypothetical protein